MSSEFKLDAQVREKLSTNANRRLRKQGMVPAVIYGAVGRDNADNPGQMLVTINHKEVFKLYNTGHFLSQIIELKVGNDNISVLPKDLQFHPVRDDILHIDFLRVSENQLVKVWVPVRFHNADKSQGLKRGGVLNIVRHDIQLICRTDSIPRFIDVDLAGTKIGHSIHINSVKLPENATPYINNRNFTIAAIAGKGAAKNDDEEETEETEE